MLLKNMTNNTMCIVQELHTLYDHLKLYYKPVRFHQYFHYILQLIYQLIFNTCNFHNLNILQYI